MEEEVSRCATCCSSPTKAPPQINRMFLVSTCSHVHCHVLAGCTVAAVQQPQRSASVASNYNGHNCLDRILYLNKVSSGVFAAGFFRNINCGAFNHLQQGLLHALPADISCNADVFTLLSHFVHLQAPAKTGIDNNHFPVSIDKEQADSRFPLLDCCSSLPVLMRLGCLPRQCR